MASLERRAATLVAALGIVLSSAGTALAEVRRIGLEGPSTVFEGEKAIFYSRDADWTLELEARSRSGEVVRFHGSRAFAPGDYDVRLVSEGLAAPPRKLRVRELPPFVSPDASEAMRLATIQIYVWDADRSTQGRVLEKLGGLLGPRLAPSAYKVKWPLAGRQATRENVDYAISELARRGYILDMYSALHGYPLQLADGDWTNPGSNPAMKSVRIFYTTACFGAGGEQDFRDAGVRTYVAARGVNFVNSFHMLAFTYEIARGRSVEEANERAFGRIARVARFWPVKKVIERFLDEGVSLEQALEASRPIVFGDGKQKLRNRTPQPSRTAGIAGRLGAFGF